MDWYMPLLLLAAFLGTCKASETVVASFEGGSSPLKLNKDEDVTIKCVIISTDPLRRSHELKWYKEQGVNERAVVGEDEEEKVPFDNVNKYNIHYEEVKLGGGGEMAESHYSLTIRGVDRNDAGNYICASGQTADSLTDSNSVQLIISPDKITPDLKTSAMKENGKYKFNLTNEVSCEASAPTSSEDLKLVISVDGEKVGPEFLGVKLTNWGGSTDGLKVPETMLSMKNLGWQPADYGEYKVTCEFMDGDRLLGMAEFTAVREEPPIEASIECYSSRGDEKIKRDDTDLLIICTARNTEGLENVFAEFEFFNLDESVTLKSGDAKYGRVFKNDPNDPQKFILDIPRAVKEIVTLGQNIYNVTLYGTKDGTDQQLDFIEFVLPVDSTSRYESGSWTLTPMTLLLFLGVIIAML